jgi:hypothetical protein
MTANLNEVLPSIPLVDVRDGGPPRHALENPAKARSLRDSCLGSLPRAAHPLVPSFDRISQRWLARSRSPYVHEMAAIAGARFLRRVAPQRFHAMGMHVARQRS